MVARKKPAKRTRRRKQAVNLVNAAEGLVQGSILTRWAFGTDLIPFLGEGWLFDKTAGRPNFDSQAFGGAANSWNLSLAEIIQSMVPGGQLGMSQAYTDLGGVWPIIMRNLRTNAPKFVISSIVTNVGFRAVKRITQKQRSQINRNVFKPLGLAKEVKV